MKDIPVYLRRYCKEQQYASYTARDQAVWRYILRQSREFFSKHAVRAYTDGLIRTGVFIDRIPRIDEIDERLGEFGWAAVGVTGFIPPAAFLDFQSRQIMPIAMEMRTLEHLAYTPAPDIVHEAAGHIPTLVDPQYRYYLSQYANMAKRAIGSRGDVMVYEAIRYLSDIKENPDTHPDTVAQAYRQLEEVSKLVSEVSEQAQVARMNWWTAEYGLVGDLSAPLIYGAGLLSSVAESRHCLSSRVKKVPLSIACVETPYSITEPQPQLFVAKSTEQLVEVLGDLDKTLAYRTGGIAGLEKARKAQTVTTVVLDSGISVSGTLQSYIADGKEAVFLQFIGGAQVCCDETQLVGHGPQRHLQGFSGPIGRWKKKEQIPPHLLSDSDLSDLGVGKGACEVELVSGFKVSGELEYWSRQSGRLCYLTWKNCTVARHGQVFFQPGWGAFDMVVGSGVVSVYGGPADRHRFGDFKLGEVVHPVTRRCGESQTEKDTQAIYGDLRELRQQPLAAANLRSRLQLISQQVAACSQKDWLLGVEIHEIAIQKTGANLQDSWLRALRESFQSHGATDDTRQIIEGGYQIAHVAD